MNLFSKISLAAAIACAASLFSLSQVQAQPDPKYGIHDRSRPTPEAIESGYPGTQDKVGKAPSDAIVLFDGTNLDKWVGDNNQPTKWVIKDGAMECVPGSGFIHTKDSFGDCQLHVEWAAPAKVEGDDQGRGNSGVFLGGGRYEVQVLDTYSSLLPVSPSFSMVYLFNGIASSPVLPDTMFVLPIRSMTFNNLSHSRITVIRFVSETFGSVKLINRLTS